MISNAFYIVLVLLFDLAGLGAATPDAPITIDMLDTYEGLYVGTVSAFDEGGNMNVVVEDDRGDFIIEFQAFLVDPANGTYEIRIPGAAPFYADMTDVHESLRYQVNGRLLSQEVRIPGGDLLYIRQTQSNVYALLEGSPTIYSLSSQFLD